MHILELVSPILVTALLGSLGWLLREVRSLRIEVVRVQVQLEDLRTNGIVKKLNDLEERVSRIEGRCEAFVHAPVKET